MELLRKKIEEEGRDIGGGILKVDAFINHQIDAVLMHACGRALAEAFGARAGQVDKVLTAEISGIPPALMTALHLEVPMVYARKRRPVTMVEEPLRVATYSHTKGREVELLLSREFVRPGERVLIVDDFLATGRTILGLMDLVKQAGAVTVGVGALIEKPFEGGREALDKMGLPVEALASIVALEEGRVVLG